MTNLDNTNQTRAKRANGRWRFYWSIFTVLIT